MRAHAVIPPAAVEVAAVKARVVEHAVQHHAHAARRGLAAQLTEILLAAEQRVDALVIARVVAVVGIGLKDRVEVDRGHAQALQIVELLDHAAQRAPEKVVVQDLAVLVRTIGRDIVPVFMQHARGDALALGLHGKPVPAEAVGEDIIGDALAEPARRLIGRVVDGQLVFIAQRVDDLAAAAIAARAVARAVRGVDGEIVPVQAGVIGRKGYAVAVARAGKPIPPHGVGLRRAAVLLHPERDVLGAVLALGIGGKRHGLPRRHSAVRRFAGRFARMVYATGNGFQTISPKLYKRLSASAQRCRGAVIRIQYSTVRPQGKQKTAPKGRCRITIRVGQVNKKDEG